ncbi:MAG: hypothetical protein OXI91_11030 [Chloroflexota bacterium]|nr:hypothetical protein [Chloroflexota bacterium]
MDKMMTWAEIEEAFDGEWVLIEDPETTCSQEIISGRVIYHSSDRAEAYSKLNELRPVHPAVMYVGTTSADKVFAL